MTDTDIAVVAKALKKEGYILLKKSAFWGSFAATLVALGLVSFSAALAAIESSVAKQVTDEIEGLAVRARTAAAATEASANRAAELLKAMQEGRVKAVTAETLTIVDAAGKKRCEIATSSEGHASVMLWNHSGQQSIGLVDWNGPERGELRRYKKGDRGTVSENVWPLPDVIPIVRTEHLSIVGRNGKEVGSFEVARDGGARVQLFDATGTLRAAYILHYNGPADDHVEALLVPGSVSSRIPPNDPRPSAARPNWVK